MKRRAEEKNDRVWRRLAMIWALYYFVAFTWGQIPQYVQKTIWFGAALVGIATVPVFWRHIRRRDLPPESTRLLFFVAWAMLGVVFVQDVAMFRLFLKLILELTLVVTAFSVIIGRSGGMHWLYLALVGVAVFRVFYNEGPINFDRIADTRVVARIAGANAVGFYCVLGIIGMLALLKEVKSIWLRGALVASGLIALYGVILSASRGALVALMATAVLWPALCMVSIAKYKTRAIAGAVVVLLLFYWVFQFIIQDTYMGVRFTRATQLEDSSTQMRLELVITGLQAFAQNPIFGVGLGQFCTISRYGHYAHNEFAEISATTGLPGLVIYFSIYWLVWQRLVWSLRYVQDPLTRYRINMGRLSLLIIFISGCLSRPNFISQDTMFLLGLVVGVSHWAERTIRQQAGSRALAAGPVPPGSAWGRPAPPWGLGTPGTAMNSVMSVPAGRSGGG